MNEEEMEKALAFIKEYEAKEHIFNVLLAVPNENNLEDVVLNQLANDFGVDITFVNNCLNIFKKKLDSKQQWFKKKEAIKYEIYQAKIKNHNGESHDVQKVIAAKMDVKHQTVKNISSELNQCKKIEAPKKDNRRSISEEDELEAVRHFFGKPFFIWTKQDVFNFFGSDVDYRTIGNYLERWGILPIKPTTKRPLGVLEDVNKASICYSDVMADAKKAGNKVLLFDHFGVSICQSTINNTKKIRELHPKKNRHTPNNSTNYNVLSVYCVSCSEVFYTTTQTISRGLIEKLVKELAKSLISIKIEKLVIIIKSDVNNYDLNELNRLETDGVVAKVFFEHYRLPEN
jgi:hypothetical protein